MAAVTPHTRFDNAADLVALHECTSLADLEVRLAAELGAIVPDTCLALCMAEADGCLRVRFTVGAGTWLRTGQDASEIVRTLPAAQRLPIRFRTHSLGELLVARPLDAQTAEPVIAALAHFGVAAGNLTLNEASRSDNDNYCGQLQVLDEGLVLFQEPDPEAVLAGLLSIATSAVQSNAGALYVLREVGDAASGLCLEQALGIPDALLAGLRGKDGCAWPDVLLDRPAQIAERSADGTMAMLAPECVPAMLQNVVLVPLRYHGVEAGLCVLFNARVEGRGAGELVSRLQSLGQLGAALLHRLRLEAMHARNRSRERELQIAETIQKRLLPTVAPATSELGFAWCAIAAQNIGGDYLDLFRPDGADVHAIIADASGHGINSALLMSSFRSTYRANAPRKQVGDLVASLNNDVVDEVGPTGMFITAAFLRIDCATRRVQMCSAGHTPVLVRRARTGSIERSESDGPPLGFMHGAEFTTQELQLETGDLMVLYTDGVTEATNAELDMFGEERLIEELQRHGDAGPDAVLEAVLARLAAFAGKERYEDDVSIVLIRAQ